MGHLGELQGHGKAKKSSKVGPHEDKTQLLMLSLVRTRLSGFEWLWVILPSSQNPYFLSRMGTSPYNLVSFYIRTQTPSPIPSFLESRVPTHCGFAVMLTSVAGVSGSASFVELPAQTEGTKSYPAWNPRGYSCICLMRQEYLLSGCLVHQVKDLWESVQSSTSNICCG